MQENTPPLEIFQVITHVDNRGRVVSRKTKLDRNNPFSVAHDEFIGLGAANVMTERGPMTVQFEIPLAGPTIFDAYDQFEAGQAPALRAHIEKLRIDAMKQGATLNQLPSAMKPPSRN